MSDTNELVERLRYGIRDVETGEPLDEGAYAHVTVDDIRAVIAALAPVEAVPVAWGDSGPIPGHHFGDEFSRASQPSGPVVCSDEAHDHPDHEWHVACIKCGVFRGSDLLAHPPAQAGAVTEAMEDELFTWLYPYVGDDGQTRILIRELFERFPALGAQTPPEGAVTFYDQNNCPVCHGIPDYFGSLVDRARDTAAKASTKFPQPNYVTLKIAEEAGEVVRGAVHYAESRMEWKEVEGEIVQLLAMLIRFVTEGDQINGITPPVNQSEGADRG